MNRYRPINIGTKCFAILTCSTNPEFLLPVQIVILEKYMMDNNIMYKVKIIDILENDFEHVKKNMSSLKLSTKKETGLSNTLFIKKNKMDTFQNKIELLNYLNEKPFFLESNYITLDKEGLKDLYIRFIKYLINFHYEKLYDLMNRRFLINTPLFENQKDVFIKRVNKTGFDDIFKKIDLTLDI